MARVVVTLLLFAMAWQSLTLARPGSSVNVLLDTAHAALHWHGEQHHHHEDGSVHVDESSESSQHVAWDQLNPTAALPTSVAQGLVHGASTAPRGRDAAALQELASDGLLRPPRLSS